GLALSPGEAGNLGLIDRDTQEKARRLPGFFVCAKPFLLLEADRPSAGCCLAYRLEPPPLHCRDRLSLEFALELTGRVCRYHPCITHAAVGGHGELHHD